jgi:hypothetical protein
MSHISPNAKVPTPVTVSSRSKLHSEML